MLDPARLTDLYAQHAPTCLLYARQFGPAVDAEAAVQEAFVRLLGQRSLPAHPRAWLLSTVRRLAIDALRSGRSRRNRERSIAVDRADWFDADPSDPIDARRAADLLQGLPDRQRECVVLRLWSGLTLTQIADVLDVAISTVHDELARAMQTLRSQLEPTHDPRPAQVAPRSVAAGR